MLSFGLSMFTSDVIEFFGSAKAVADALGISPQAVGAWKTIVPPASAIQLADQYPDRFKIDPSLYRNWPKMNQELSGAA